MRRSFLFVIYLFSLFLTLPSCERQSDSDQARKILVDYFAFLNEGRYEQAAGLYGGTYDVLTEWNPDLEAGERAALLERGCTRNGLQCLPAASIVACHDSAPGIFWFNVTFENPDGSRFELISQDAETAGIGPATSFPFTVVETDSGLRVMELPVYVP